MINLTPHDITLRMPDGVDMVLPASGTVARVASVETVTGEFMGVPVVSRQLGEVTGLPEDGVACIVSAMVLAAVPGRPMTFAPDTGPTGIRDLRGQVIAVSRLVAA